MTIGDVFDESEVMKIFESRALPLNSNETAILKS
jgi:hypothetical protein